MRAHGTCSPCGVWLCLVSLASQEKGEWQGHKMPYMVEAPLSRGGMSLSSPPRPCPSPLVHWPTSWALFPTSIHPSEEAGLPTPAALWAPHFSRGWHLFSHLLTILSLPLFRPRHFSSGGVSTIGLHLPRDTQRLPCCQASETRLHSQTVLTFIPLTLCSLPLVIPDKVALTFWWPLLTNVQWTLSGRFSSASRPAPPASLFVP